MAFTHTLKLDYEKDGETYTYVEDYAFKNGKEASSQPVSGKPPLSLEAWDEWAHLKQHINIFKNRTGATSIEITFEKKK